MDEKGEVWRFRHIKKKGGQDYSMAVDLDHDAGNKTMDPGAEVGLDHGGSGGRGKASADGEHQGGASR